MSDNFIINTKQDLSKDYKNLHEKIINAGGIIKGDDKFGEFSIKGVIGTYNLIDKNKIEIAITKKPWLISIDYIKKILEQYLN